MMARLLLTACASTMLGCPAKDETKGAPSAKRESAAAQAPAATPSTPKPEQQAAMGPTGALDEAAFKKLHELRGDQAPAARGVAVEIATGDMPKSSAYLSLPTGGTPPLAAVVVIHEWWGLNDHIRHWADRLAGEGYAALAVDLYDGKLATTPDEAMSLVRAVDPERAAAILAAAHEFVRSDGRIRAEKEAVIGWCFGGGWSLKYAIAQPDLDAAVIYYGQLVTDEAELKKIGADVLGVFANEDQSIPPAAVDAFEAAVKAAGKSIKIERYDAAHAFANPSGAHYDMEDAEDAWKHVQSFLRGELQPGA